MCSATLRMILLLSALAGRMHAFAQSYQENYEYINTQQGLPHNTVLALVQDSRGYLWIGTYNGLSVYDGHSFRTYRQQGNAPGDAGILAVNTIYEDRHRNMWIGSWRGRLSCFLHDENKFRQYYPVTGSLPNESRVKCVYEDSAGRIWIGYDNGLLGRIDSDSIRYVYQADGSIELIGQTTADALVLLLNRGLLTYDLSARKATTLKPGGWCSALSYSGSLLPQQGVLFVIGERCMLTDLKRNCVRASAALLPFRHSLYHLSCPARGGFIYTNGATVRWYDVHGNLRDSLEISDNIGYDRNVTLNCMTEDRSGILWIGTNSGLLKIDRQRYRFVKYSRDNSSARLERNYIRGLLVSGDEAWIGFKEGPVTRLLFNERTGIYDRAAVFPWQERDGRITESYTINTFCRLHDGRLIAGGALGICLVSTEERKLVCFPPGIIPEGLGQVWVLHQDADSNIWVGTNGLGLYIIHPVQGLRARYRSIGPAGTGVNNDRIWNIRKDRNGNIWIGTDNGLYTVRNTADIRHLQFEKYMLGPFGAEHVWCLTEDRQGRLWVGTAGDGLYCISHRPRTIWKCSALPVPIVSAVLPDAQDNLWIGTIDGIYKYSIPHHTLSRFDEQDGLISNDINFKAACLTPRGDMLFGSKMGMVQFRPSALTKRDLHLAPVQFTRIVVAGSNVPLPPDGKALQLSHLQNFFEVDFAVLDFSKPRDHTYRYMLHGFDKDWKSTERGQHLATYTNVPPGSYRFSVQGSADGHQWSRHTAELDIRIRPALWQRPVFRLISGGVLLAGIVLIVYRRMRQLIEKERQAHRIGKKMAELELQALQSQMNPHFIFNTLNSIQHFIVHNNEIAANDYLSRFSKLMRLFLESSKSRYISVHNELEILELYLSLEKLRFHDNFDYEINVEDPGLHNLLMPSMLVQPFAENAILHGLMHREGKGLLKIGFGTTGGDPPYLRCTVDDNGIGRERSTMINARRSGHISRGMMLIEERIRTYNFIEEQQIRIHITDRQLPLEGTLVEILIPVNGITLQIPTAHDHKRNR